jgi:hypothetical protein
VLTFTVSQTRSAVSSPVSPSAVPINTEAAVAESAEATQDDDDDADAMLVREKQSVYYTINDVSSFSIFQCLFSVFLPMRLNLWFNVQGSADHSPTTIAYKQTIFSEKFYNFKITTNNYFHSQQQTKCLFVVVNSGVIN